MKPVHIVSDENSISPLVLMPGDPLRAKYIAETFLEDSFLINDVRNMLGFTGTYRGKRITVIGSGMGCPSMGIYAYELAHFYGVKKIIRIGSAGSLDRDVHIKDLVVATSSHSASTFAYSWNRDKTHVKTASASLIESFKKVDVNNKVHYGKIITSDTFDVYAPLDGIEREIDAEDAIAIEMETFALYHIGEIEEIETASILTVVDSVFEPENTIPAYERENSLNDMIKLALEVLIDEKV